MITATRSPRIRGSRIAPTDGSPAHRRIVDHCAKPPHHLPLRNTIETIVDVGPSDPRRSSITSFDQRRNGVPVRPASNACCAKRPSEQQPYPLPLSPRTTHSKPNPKRDSVKYIDVMAGGGASLRRPRRR